jgi:WXXGXW repeat (2 copies)
MWEEYAVVRRIAALLMLALCLASLQACVIAPGPVYGRPGVVWVPGHWNGWRWVPGHWA